MKMRKITSAVLAGVMIVLCGCGGNEATPDIESERAEFAEMSERLEAFSEELAAISEVVAAGTTDEIASEEVRESEATVLEDTMPEITSAAEESKKTSSVSLAEIPEQVTEQTSADKADDSSYGVIPFSDEAFEYPEEPLTVENLMKITMAAKLKIAKEDFVGETYSTSTISMCFGLFDADFDGFPELFSEMSDGRQGPHKCRLYSLKKENFAERLTEYNGHYDYGGYTEYMWHWSRGEQGKLSVVVYNNTASTGHIAAAGNTYVDRIIFDGKSFTTSHIFTERWDYTGVNRLVEFVPRELEINGEKTEAYDYQKAFKIFFADAHPLPWVQEPIGYGVRDGVLIGYGDETEKYQQEIYDCYDFYFKAVKMEEMQDRDYWKIFNSDDPTYQK